MKFLPEYSWLVSTPFLIAPSVLYVLAAVYFSRQTSGKPSPANAKLIANLMRVYNLVQIGTCLYMTVGLWPVLGFPNFFGVDSDLSADGEWFVLVHYVSKWLDWFDTFFIIAKGNAAKQLSFLHVYHHSTIGVVWGIVLSLGAGSGTIRYGALINSVTHVLMYSHYLWTSFGLKNPFKSLLTKWQITQFYSCFLHACLVLLGSPYPETKIPRDLAWLQFGYHITMVYLFTFQMAWIPKMYLPPDAPKKTK